MRVLCGDGGTGDRIATWSARWGISGAFLAVPFTACIATSWRSRRPPCRAEAALRCVLRQRAKSASICPLRT